MNPAAASQLLARAQSCMARGALSDAEQALAPLLRSGDPRAMGALGIIRLAQRHPEQAATLLASAHTALPRDPLIALNLGRALAGLGRAIDAEAAMRAGLRLQPDWAEAYFELGQLLHRQGKLDAAEVEFRNVLRVMPGLTHAKLALASVMTDQGRPADGEDILRRALTEGADASLADQIALQLAVCLLRQRKDEDALATAEAVRARQPRSARAELCTAEALQNLGRYEQALAILRDLVGRAPNDPGLHHDYNALLYRLGRDDEFLKSYDRAPADRALMLGKAGFLMQTGRAAEAHDIYSALSARDPNDLVAALAAARTLAKAKSANDADAAFDALLKRSGVPAGAYVQAAEAALLAGKPEKAARLCEDGLALSPGNGACLALLGTAWRMLDDERDEVLSGYDTLVRSFDLEPPEGFSSMEEFNARLNSTLDRFHPDTREFLGQSLRGGTQTPDNLFGAGIAMVDSLRTRIDAAVARYIAELPQDDTHPFLSRRTGSFRYAGSWSSRLKDNGFHVNHIHPKGWISSCYYVAVPPATAEGRQGWIKFGEPQLDVALKDPVRHAIRPAAGRLVLFPSYLWHGTIPFRDSAARTTIAFDVTPQP